MFVKARIVKLVKNNELKSLSGSVRYVLASAHEQLVKIIKKYLLSSTSVIYPSSNMVHVSMY